MIATNAADLGAMLRTGRRAKGLSQQDLADLVGVTRQWVISAERGRSTAQVDLMLTALRSVDLLVDVVPDESMPAIDVVLGADHGG